MRDRPTPFSTADWAGDSARRWALHADRLEAQLGPISDILFEAAQLTPGMRVLDIGCGRGVTTRRAAAAVAPSGSAVGIDVADNLLAEAAELSLSIENVEWIRADAQLHAFPPTYDALISRFGVMFFDDAIAAFANLHGATRPNARLTVVTWQPRDRSTLFEVPLSLGSAIAERLGVSVVGDATTVDGGAFSFGTPDRVRGILGAAGWRSVEIELRTVALYNGGPASSDVAADVSLAIGPLRAALEPATDEQRAAVRSELAAALEPYHDGIGVRLEGAIAVVTATA